MEQVWQQQCLYNIQDIKQINPIPELVNDLKHFLPNLSTSEVTTILTELYNNSVDHGLLGLSSEIKHQKDGLEKFYQIRKQKLSELNNGFVNLNLAYDSQDQLLIITIRDSGPGFNYDQYNTMPLMLHKVSGKGIYIINRLAEKVEYSAAGNEITVFYKVRSDEGAVKELQSISANQICQNKKASNG